MSTASDWISAVATLCATGIAGAAAWFGLRTFAHQRTVNDVQMAVGIFNQINHYWDRLIDSKNYDYNMGQILSYFEIACSLFNRNILTDSANLVLGDHIVEVFTQIIADEKGRKFIDRCLSSPNTFSELKCFFRRRMPQALNSMAFAKGDAGRKVSDDPPPEHA